jgi:uncharacterized membrane protein
MTMQSPSVQVGTSKVGTSEKDRRPAAKSNVGEPERWLSLLAGGALLVYGIKHPSKRGLLATAVGGALVYRGKTGYCGMYAMMGANTSTSTIAPKPFMPAIRVKKSVLVQAPASTLYNYWRQLDNLPKFMQHLKSVTVKEEGKSHWVTGGPNGKDYQWDAVITNDKPNESIAWKSEPGADVVNAGEVTFEEQPFGRGTKVTVTLEYRPPAGVVGFVIAKFQGVEPGAQVEDDLRHFRQLMETGETATTLGQSRGANVSNGQRASRFDQYFQADRGSE